MKKCVIWIILLSNLLLGGCMKDTSGYMEELKSHTWQSQFAGGVSVSLSFSEDTASLFIENAGESAQICGKYVLDDHQLVIFVPEISQNYGFSYIPCGDSLELRYGDETVILDKIK